MTSQQVTPSSIGYMGTNKTDFQLGDLIVKPELNELLKDGVPAHLDPLLMDILVNLVENAPRIVSADELLDQFWAGAVVEESTIHRRISQIRQALGDDARNPTYIATVPKRGYRVIADVTKTGAPNPLGDNQQAQRPRAMARIYALSFAVVIGFTLVLSSWLGYLRPVETGVESKSSFDAIDPVAASIAVLPFQNLGQSESDYYAEGIHDVLIHNLSRVPGLKVIAHSSVYYVAETDQSKIGEELDVEHILRGTVRRDSENVHISVQLIKLDTNTTIWTDTFEPTPSDTFHLQSEIAGEIARELKVPLDMAATSAIARLPTENLEAYEKYVLGRQLRRQIFGQTWHKAAGLFMQAIELDPGFSKPMADIAIGQMYSGDYRLVWDLPGVTRQVERAYALNPEDVMSLFAKARLASIHRDDDVAVDFYRRALRAEPNNGEILGMFAEHLTRMGRYSTAAELVYRKLALDPKSAEANIATAHLLIDQSKISESMAYLDTAIELSGESDGLRHSAANAFLRSGDLAKAMEIWFGSTPSSAPAISRYLAYLDEFESSRMWIKRIRDSEEDAMLEVELPDFFSKNAEKILKAHDEKVARIADLRLGLLLWVEGNTTEFNDFTSTQVLERASDPMFLQLYAYSIENLARESDTVNNAQRARELRLSAITALDQSLESDAHQNRVQLKGDNLIPILFRAMLRKQVGKIDEAQEDARSFLAFSLQQPSYRVTDGHFLDGVAHILLDDKAQAMLSFASIEQNSPGFYRTDLFDGFGIANLDQMVNDPSFLAIVEKTRSRNKKLALEIRSNLPLLFSTK